MKPDKLTFKGRKHTEESNKKRSETLKRMYSEGTAKFGFKTKYSNEDERIEARKVRRLMERYGITKEDFNAMLDLQNGKCKICDNPAVVVDHDHKTKVVRGLLCSKCNLGIGYFQDDSNLLTSASNYIKEASNENKT